MDALDMRAPLSQTNVIILERAMVSGIGIPPTLSVLVSLTIERRTLSDLGFPSLQNEEQRVIYPLEVDLTPSQLHKAWSHDSSPTHPPPGLS